MTRDQSKDRAMRLVKYRKGHTGKKLPAKIVPPKGPAASVPVPKKQKSAS